jgi:sterol O-acyltransferase
MDNKNIFRLRASYFDLADPTAGIYRSGMAGFYSLYFIVSIGYIAMSVYTKYLSHGILVEGSFFHFMLRDLHLLALTWLGFSLWSWLALALELMIVRGLPHWIALVFQNISQSLMFIMTCYLVITRDWGFSQTLFVTCLVLVHFMKMHSYTMSNRDLREASKKNPSTSLYPANLNIANFWNYMLSPVLVYEPNYPRSLAFRTGYFVKKTLLCMSQMTFTYIICVDHLIPIMSLVHQHTYWETVLRLMLPMIAFILSMFLILFELLLNLFAELSGFADRAFYHDWWNSVNYSEFNRKWNRTVHLFLYRHLYLEAHIRWGLTVGQARFVTFMFSSLCHEMILALIFRMVRPFLLAFMMFQIPLVLIEKRIQSMELGGYIIWFGIVLGVPIITSLYLHSMTIL